MLLTVSPLEFGFFRAVLRSSFECCLSYISFFMFQIKHSIKHSTLCAPKPHTQTHTANESIIIHFDQVQNIRWQWTFFSPNFSGRAFFIARQIFIFIFLHFIFVSFEKTKGKNHKKDFFCIPKIRIITFLCSFEWLEKCRKNSQTKRRKKCNKNVFKQRECSLLSSLHVIYSIPMNYVRVDLSIFLVLYYA